MTDAPQRPEHRLPPPPPGYDLVGWLGSGGSGTAVLKARQRSLDRMVALKFLGDTPWTSGADLERLIEEGRALAALNHSNIVSIYDVLRSKEGTWLVMEYVDGPSLSGLTGDGAGLLPVSFAVSVLLDVAHALGAAHAIGIVHRDVKPANIMLSLQGSALLADFGLAHRWAAGQAGDRPGEAEIAGTPAYMSPEQASGEQLDARSDVYSLGVVAYELLSGRRPFAELAGNLWGLLEAHRSRLPDPLAEVAPSVPPSMANLVMESLAKQPARRPPDGAALARELARLADGLVPGWRTAPKPFERIRATRPADTSPADEAVTLTACSAAAVPAVLPPEPDTVPAPAAVSPGHMTIDDPRATLSIIGRPEGSPITPGTAAEPAVSPRAPEQAARRRIRRRATVVAVAVGLAAAASAGVVLAGRSAPTASTATAPTASPAPLGVRRISLAVSPKVGHCPGTVFRFSGSIFTNGQAGKVAYEWREPGGELSRLFTVEVPKGSDLVEASLTYTYSGSAPGGGFAQLRSLSPARASSPRVAVAYRC